MPGAGGMPGAGAGGAPEGNAGPTGGADDLDWASQWINIYWFVIKLLLYLS